MIQLLQNLLNTQNGSSVAASKNGASSGKGDAPAMPFSVPEEETPMMAEGDTTGLNSFGQENLGQGSGHEQPTSSDDFNQPSKQPTAVPTEEGKTDEGETSEDDETSTTSAEAPVVVHNIFSWLLGRSASTEQTESTQSGEQTVAKGDVVPEGVINVEAGKKGNEVAPQATAAVPPSVNVRQPLPASKQVLPETSPSQSTLPNAEQAPRIVPLTVPEVTAQNGKAAVPLEGGTVPSSQALPVTPTEAKKRPELLEPLKVDTKEETLRERPRVLPSKGEGASILADGAKQREVAEPQAGERIANSKQTHVVTDKVAAQSQIQQPIAKEAALTQPDLKPNEQNRLPQEKAPVTSQPMPKTIAPEKSEANSKIPVPRVEAIEPKQTTPVATLNKEVKVETPQATQPTAPLKSESKTPVITGESVRNPASTGENNTVPKTELAAKPLPVDKPDNTTHSKEAKQPLGTTPSKTVEVAAAPVTKETKPTPVESAKVTTETKATERASTPLNADTKNQQQSQAESKESKAVVKTNSEPAPQPTQSTKEEAPSKVSSPVTADRANTKSAEVVSTKQEPSLSKEATPQRTETQPKQAASVKSEVTVKPESNQVQATTKAPESNVSEISSKEANSAHTEKPLTAPTKVEPKTTAPTEAKPVPVEKPVVETNTQKQSAESNVKPSQDTSTRTAPELPQERKPVRTDAPVTNEQVANDEGRNVKRVDREPAQRPLQAQTQPQPQQSQPTQTPTTQTPEPVQSSAATSKPVDTANTSTSSSKGIERSAENTERPVANDTRREEGDSKRDDAKQRESDKRDEVRAATVRAENIARAQSAESVRAAMQNQTVNENNNLLNPNKQSVTDFEKLTGMPDAKHKATMNEVKPETMIAAAKVDSGTNQSRDTGSSYSQSLSGSVSGEKRSGSQSFSDGGNSRGQTGDHQHQQAMQSMKGQPGSLASQMQVAFNEPSAYTSLRAEVIPAILQQIDRFRKLGKSNLRMKLELPGGERLTLQLRLDSDRVKVRFQTESDDLRDFLNDGWAGLANQASKRGIKLDIPEFIEEPLTEAEDGNVETMTEEQLKQLV